jgi:tRNA isopentenyl-2-thiomethyl-A-37 hydroxylase MiaE
MFELSKADFEGLRTQNAFSKRGGIRYMPFAFTEQGVAMLSAVLNSDKAIDVNIAIMRAFVFIRQYALSHKDLTEKLTLLETKYNKHFKDIYEALDYLLTN